ncbi:hypothetical protein [Helicobacter sp. 13S00477-4]|uniref:hypothetical protein n=1 Tax=Helicobacter sp. 13S00477-4 TaxID=1905759 RepID=UPI000BA636CA|nr:hypothetical protein [Helicobacter sp. 13S00477-4]PAF51994.1 hypothetical protein BKH44_04860 [Helicobacter sp. 13S00477-4]
MEKDIKKLNITYSGEGIVNGEIDLENFASSILNFGKALQVIKKYLGIENLDIKVIATKEGSFEVDLALITQGWEAFKNLFSSQEASVLANLITVLGIGGVGSGIIALYQHLKGKEPKHIQKNEDNISITNQNNITLNFSSVVVDIYQDIKFREYMENFAKTPLDSDFIDKINIKHNDKILQIPKSDKEFYKKALWTKDTDIQTRIYTQTFSIVTLTFNKFNKWKLADSRGNINAIIKDEMFLSKIENDEIEFAKGDKLICEVELIEDLSEDKINASYSILKVKEHIKSSKARRLPGLG